MEKNNSSSVTSGLAWTFAERITAQLVSTVVTIILARLLAPTHYGIISIVTVFITFCNVLVTSGLGSSVVRKKDADEKDFNTAFWLSMFISIVLYIIIFWAAPIIADFYKMAELTAVIRVMGIRIPLAALNSIQQAHIQRNMKFKKFFIATLFGTTVSAVVGISLAVSGFGVWALVAQYLTNTTIDSIVLLIVGEWKPKFQFSWRKAKEIYSFGWKVLVTNVIFTFSGDLRSLIVGKVFGSADLAYFDQGKKYPSLLVTNVNTAINKVMLPKYAKQQDDLEKLKNTLRKSIKMGIFVMTPILVGFALVADNFVRVILTEKWIDAIPFIQIFSIEYLTRPLESSCHQALLAIGRSDLVLYIIILINVFGLATTLFAVFVLKSVLGIALGLLLTQCVSFIGFMFMTWKHIKYTPKEQLRDIAPVIGISIIMALAVIVMSNITNSPLINLIIQILVGGCTYIVASYIAKVEAFQMLKNKIKPMLNHVIRRREY